MLRNVGSNWVLILVTTVATYVLTPFVIRTLGQGSYGTWTLITAMTGYISLLALGVPMASVRYLTQYVTEATPRKADEAAGTCCAIYPALGVVALAVGALLWDA